MFLHQYQLMHYCKKQTDLKQSALFTNLKNETSVKCKFCPIFYYIP